MATAQDILNHVNTTIAPLTVDELAKIPKTADGNGYVVETILNEVTPTKRYTKILLNGVHKVSLMLPSSQSEVVYNELYLIGVDLLSPPNPLVLTQYSDGIEVFLAKVAELKTSMAQTETTENSVWTQLATELGI